MYLSRTRKGTMRSNMVIDKVNDMKVKLGVKMTLMIFGQTKVEISIKVDNSAKKMCRRSHGHRKG